MGDAAESERAGRWQVGPGECVVRGRSAGRRRAGRGERLDSSVRVWAGASAGREGARERAWGEKGARLGCRKRKRSWAGLG